MSSWLEPKAAPAWILSAGMALVSLGLVAQSQDDPPTTNTPQFLPAQPGYGTADSNGSMIAVTGVDVTGGSILYLIDTQGRHLSVYAAQSGTASTSHVKWVGARNIDYDLQVDGFNDKSELKYKELAQKIAESGSSAAGDKH
jgi:hypothetical protein